MWQRQMSPGPALHHLRSSHGGSQRKCDPYSLCTPMSRSSHIGTKQGMGERNETALLGGKDKQVKRTKATKVASHTSPFAVLLTATAYSKECG